MIYTNLLTKANFSSMTGNESSFDISAFIPGGVLDVSHLTIRYRAVGAYWSAWGAVDAWNPTTKVVTWSRPAITLDQVEIRRSTPRYSLWRDPILRTSRVSEKNFHANADQGVFVATEWAAQYGIDAQELALADPGDGPNELGLVQQTQNHWGSNANFGQTSWNFQFAGGYIARSHVRAQALLPSGWTQLSIDPSENDPGDPSDAPFRFIGDYQLRLDLATLGAPVTGLVIYRHTPRDVNVAVPLDNTRITSVGMEPSARHAVFVAVEIGEELSKRVPPCECVLYYTSLLYPLITDEAMRIGPMAGKPVGYSRRMTEDDFHVGVMSLIAGDILPTITFNFYTNWRDVNPQFMHVPVMSLRSGTLVSSINPVSYVNWRDVVPENCHVPVMSLRSGTLVVSINFLSYVRWRDVIPENMHVPVMTLLSGTLV